MSSSTGIEWTQATWNPWHGCHKVSAGCKNCYMFREKIRYGQNPNIVVRSKTKFTEPLKWKEPKLIFTCSWSDWFIEEADAWREEAYDVIRQTPHHTYQILTKRSDRLMGLLWPVNPLPNVWLGVSVESRDYLSRIDDLRCTPAAIRFLSLEPLLEDLGPLNLEGVHWVIVGGESGKGARPMHPDWVRSIRDQCILAGVPFFFKQWGSWEVAKKLNQDSDHGDVGLFEGVPSVIRESRGRNASAAGQCRAYPLPASRVHRWPDGSVHIAVGKKKAGRLLDGRTWEEMPFSRGEQK